MKLEAAVAQIHTLMETAAYDRSERFYAIVDLIAEFLVSAVLRDERHGEVGIMLLAKGEAQLAFVYPAGLRRGSCFPVDRRSLAGQAVLSGEPILSNAVPEQPHHAFYERVPGRDGKVHTIQKMLVGPVRDEAGKVIGVIETSLCGPSPEEAGRDLTREDLARLEKLAMIFGPFLRKSYPGEESLAHPAGVFMGSGESTGG